MPLVLPFRGIRFNREKIGRLEDVLSPPYDVVGPELDAWLKALSPYNMIHLDISKGLAPDTAEENRYLGPRRLLDQCMSANILRRDDVPAIYLYDTEYRHPDGRTLIRRGFVALVGLAEFAEGIVRPHEQTFRAVIGDRLRLMEVCGAQFSQIFSLYSDPEGQVLAALDAAGTGERIMSALDQQGCRHSLSPVTDAEACRRVTKLLADRPVYIADGHHRYTTSLVMRERAAARGALPPDSPANFTMMYLSPMEEPGLSTLPAHRLVLNPGVLPLAACLDSLARDFLVEQLPAAANTGDLLNGTLALMEEKGGAGAVVLGLYHAESNRAFVLVLKSGAAADDPVYGHRPAPLKALDVVVLADLAIGRHLGLDAGRCEKEGLIGYYSDLDEARLRAEEGCAAGKAAYLFLLRPTPVSQVRDVADAGCIMPHKSSYFYPKVLTGLVFQSMDSPVFLD